MCLLSTLFSDHQEFENILPNRGNANCTSLVLCPETQKDDCSDATVVSSRCHETSNKISLNFLPFANDTIVMFSPRRYVLLALNVHGERLLQDMARTVKKIQLETLAMKNNLSSLFQKPCQFCQIKHTLIFAKSISQLLYDCVCRYSSIPSTLWIYVKKYSCSRRGLVHCCKASSTVSNLIY